MRLKKMCSLIGVLLLIFFMAGSAAGENKDGGVTITPYAGKAWFDNDYNLQDNEQWGIAISNNITKNWSVEGALNYIDSSATETVLGNKEDVNVYFYHVDGLYHFLPETQFVPFLAAGIGGLAFDRDGTGTDNDYSFNYGAGLKIFLVEQVALRADLRHVLSWDDITDPDDTYNNFIASLGVGFQFGGEKAVLPDGDADGDGVKDSVDKCPDTAPGTPVNAIGCNADSDADGVFDADDKCPDTPRGIKVDETGCPPDSDGDGVADFHDNCPNTPAGTPVDASGCPLVAGAIDTDKDGVPDEKDLCAGTPVGAAVNQNGCWIIEGLLFDTNKSIIKPQSKAGLDNVINILKQNPDLKLQIQGHTDSTGSMELNNRLSRERAEAVKDYIMKEGIGDDRLTAIGYGPTKPAASNSTVAGRAQNRRVELQPVE